MTPMLIPPCSAGLSEVGFRDPGRRLFPYRLNDQRSILECKTVIRGFERSSRDGDWIFACRGETIRRSRFNRRSAQDIARVATDKSG